MFARTARCSFAPLPLPPLAASPGIKVVGGDVAEETVTYDGEEGVHKWVTRHSDK